MAEAEPIPTHVFDSDVLPPEQQFAAWAGFTAHSRVTRPEGGDGRGDARLDRAGAQQPDRRLAAGGEQQRREAEQEAPAGDEAPHSRVGIQLDRARPPSNTTVVPVT